MVERLASLVAVVAFLASGMTAGAEPASGVVGVAVDSVGITVDDMDRAVEFYRDILTFVPVSDFEIAGDGQERFLGVFGARVRVVRMQLGAEAIELMQFLAPRGRPLPADSRSNDLWFQHVAIIVSDIDEAYEMLRKHGVEHASTGPQWLPDWNPNAGGISAFYFRDPDGNHLEILAFPPDKGEERWQADDLLFLGIDHTAIVVDDTDRSLELYRDALGMRIVGESENYGAEQERLNNVFGARLRITALRAREGIGVELLEYLAPRTGRPMPVDTRANDAWHWQVNFVATELSVVDTAVRERRASYVSPGIVTLGRPEHAEALMVRDPDGHAMAFRRSVSE
jgi:catechol 2,3-dioxygenase-like lactoylglutathione lyase family enzyme